MIICKYILGPCPQADCLKCDFCPDKEKIRMLEAEVQRLTNQGHCDG